MRQRLIAAVLAAGLLVLSGCSGEDADPKPSPDPSSAPDTVGPGSEHLLVHGTVTRDGEPVSGATVALTLFPDGADVEVGDSVETFSTPKFETDEDGAYTISLDPDELSSTYFNGDYLNFEINVATGDQRGLWNSTVWLKRHKYWRSDDRALVGDSVVDISVDLDDETITLTDSFGESEESEFTMFGTPHSEEPVAP